MVGVGPMQKKRLQRKHFFITAAAMMIAWMLLGLVAKPLGIDPNIVIGTLSPVIGLAVICVLLGIETKSGRRYSETHRFEAKVRRDKRALPVIHKN